MENNLLTRYSEITQKNPREIVLLRGAGCKWRRCTFCDYHLDFSLDEESNCELNQLVLAKVTGKYQKLEVINSGSFVDLDQKTFDLIIDTCVRKGIKEIHFECHWMHKDSIPALRECFAKLGIITKIKPNHDVIRIFMQELYPIYKDNHRIDILIENTDFGVG